MAFEVREARTEGEVEAAGRVTVAANAEFAPSGPDDPFVPSWARYLTSMADAAGRATAGATLLVAVEDRRVVGTVTLYLSATSEQWRPDDAMFRFRPSTRRRGPRGSAGPCPGLPRPGQGGGKRAWPCTPRVDGHGQGHVRAGRVPARAEGDAQLPGVTIIAYAG